MIVHPSLTFLTMWITGAVAWSRYDGQVQYSDLNIELTFHWLMCLVSRCVVSGSRRLDNALFFNSIRVVDGVEVGSGFVKYYKELMNVIHEDRSWCFGNLRIFTFQPWPDHPESCAWVPKPNSRFSSNQAHSQQIQFRTWHQVCFPVCFPKQNIPYSLFHCREDDLDGYSSSGSLVAWAFPCDLT